MKYNYEIRLKAVKLVLEGGLSVREAGCHLGCGRSQVHLWVTLFERHGLAGLKLRHGSYSAEFKLSVLKHMHQNHLSLLETAVHFGIPGLLLFVNGSGSIKTKVLKACGVNRKEGAGHE